MKIYVCVKHVPDTAADITITGQTHIDEEITFIVNPYDEHAIEEAVRVKDRVDDAEIIAVTLGKKTAEDTLRSALAMGAERGILVLSDTTADSLITARAIKTAIEQDGKADIIFTGKESIDSEGSQIMYRLGALFNMPVASNVVSFSMAQERVSVECEMATGERQVVEMQIPCIIGAGKGLNEPRYPKLPAILKAMSKEIKTIELADLKFERPTSRVETIRLNPAVEKRNPKELTGTPGEVADKIIRILREEANLLS
jgi:electron transfer flavoprotein beta subunit